MKNMETVTTTEIEIITIKMIGVARKNGIQYHDCLDLAQDVLLKACKKYDSSKARFSSFCWYLFNSRMIDGFRRKNNWYNKKIVKIDKYKDTENGNNNEIQSKKVNSMEVLKMHLKDNYDNGIINKKQFNILCLRGMGHDFYEIASILDISLGSAHGNYESGLASICKDDGILGV